MNTSWIKRDPVNDRDQKAPLNLLDAVKALGVAIKPLLCQLKLHGQMISVEWEEEKIRMSHLFFLILIGLACLTCVLAFIGILLIAASWDTSYRLLTIAILCFVYGLATYLCLKKMLSLLQQPEAFFAISRKEFKEDIAVISKHFL